MSDHMEVTLIRFCTACGTEIGLVAPAGVFTAVTRLEKPQALRWRVCREQWRTPSGPPGQ